MTQRAAELRKLADAAEPLYQSLSDDQQNLRSIFWFAWPWGIMVVDGLMVDGVIMCVAGTGD